MCPIKRIESENVLIRLLITRTTENLVHTYNYNLLSLLKGERKELFFKGKGKDQELNKVF